MSRESNPPITLSDQTPVRTRLGVLIGVLLGVAAAAVAYASLSGDVASHAKQLAAQEDRIKKLETAQADVAVIKNDVQWIRRELERSGR